MGFLIKDKHQTIIEEKINDELRFDLGSTVVIHQQAVETDCPYCKFDSVSGRSSNIPEIGKDWSTHPNYKGTDMYCPNCLSRGVIQTDNTTSITAIVSDKLEFEFVEGKPGKFDRGKKTVVGKLTDISGRTNFNDNILFKAVKVVIGNTDYKVVSVEEIRLLESFAFEAVVQRLDRNDLPSSNVLTS